MITTIVTIPPYAPFIDEIVRHPIVSGLRLNTVMPVKDGKLEELVKKLRDQAKDKELYIDLKCRQLRTPQKKYWQPPFTEIELTHSISVETPVTAYFSDGEEHATVLEVQGNKLFMQEGPRRVVGPGESVNIPHHSLKVEGYFTVTDKQYIEAAGRANVHTYMLSFVEEAGDVQALYALDLQAKPILKIESRKGIHYVTKQWKIQNSQDDQKQGDDLNNQKQGNNHKKWGRLMAARGDLYVELNKPHHLIEAMETIIGKDPTAIAASRILPSLASSYLPSSQDLSDIDSLVRMGYRTLMLGDDVCMKRESVLSALNLLQEMDGYYERRR